MLTRSSPYRWQSSDDGGRTAARLVRGKMIEIASYLPPLMPILMPARLALGHLAMWEMPLAVAIMLASIYGMARLAGRIYATGLVSGGSRLSWLVALRLRQ